MHIALQIPLILLIVQGHQASSLFQKHGLLQAGMQSSFTCSRKFSALQYQCSLHFERPGEATEALRPGQSMACVLRRGSPDHAIAVLKAQKGLDAAP